MDEIARIAMLAKILGRAGERADGIQTGIGDDAAVLAVPASAAGDGEEATKAKLVWTIDEQVEGTHFRRELLSWRDVGWRSFMAAVSDVAAMGGEPWCALSALVLPGDVDDAAMEAIVKGQAEAAEEVGAPVVGGNLARGTVLSIATTVLGRAVRPVLRGGAKAGDGLWLAGSVGLAAAGFRALTQGKGEDAKLAAAVASWRLPRALVAQGRAMARTAHAAIDVSDGLARDVGHIAEASGVKIVIDEALLLGDGALRAAAEALGEEALGFALHGGEDYALAVANEGPVEGFRRIGEVREGKGLVLRGARGEREIEPEGFDHFR